MKTEIKTAEEILNRHTLHVSRHPSREQALKAMEAYHAQFTGEERAYRIIDGDEVNSFHSAIMRNLNPEQLVILRDKLIRRTPPIGGEEWISVKDRLPEKHHAVLLYSEESGVSFECLHPEEAKYYTHWKEVNLPKP